jgi:hypothetical protein
MNARTLICVQMTRDDKKQTLVMTRYKREHKMQTLGAPPRTDCCTINKNQNSDAGGSGAVWRKKSDRAQRATETIWQPSQMMLRCTSRPRAAPPPPCGISRDPARLEPRRWRNRRFSILRSPESEERVAAGVRVSALFEENTSTKSLPQRLHCPEQ